MWLKKRPRRKSSNQTRSKEQSHLRKDEFEIQLLLGTDISTHRFTISTLILLIHPSRTQSSCTVNEVLQRYEETPEASQRDTPRNPPQVQRTHFESGDAEATSEFSSRCQNFVPKSAAREMPEMLRPALRSSNTEPVLNPLPMRQHQHKLAEHMGEFRSYCKTILAGSSHRVNEWVAI